MKLQLLDAGRLYPVAGPRHCLPSLAHSRIISELVARILCAGTITITHVTSGQPWYQPCYRRLSRALAYCGSWSLIHVGCPRTDEDDDFEQRLASYLVGAMGLNLTHKSVPLRQPAWASLLSAP
ncbi:hypothetical protein VTK73DRAFT_8193 [Phialemonium thermophilum]|uniref:Uncharacterized protein n=1 Tax=Phialemonium thermophilum TaxID=223376 RepID=A0ABR3XQ64_9PEZI